MLMHKLLYSFGSSWTTKLHAPYGNTLHGKNVCYIHVMQLKLPSKIYDLSQQVLITIQSSTDPRNSQISGHFVIPLNPKV